ncbi:MAG: C4-dicarboxylate ABC transporter substrate-binding protein [Rhodospirillaceae bacterium]|nr:C4-dicarboxylate ABC transporter substrate-binding protein [Rhodospirillaceae bacterium]
MSFINHARRLLIAAGAATLLAHAPARAAEHEWNMQIAAQAGEIIFDIGQDFAERVDRMTAGRIKLNIMPVGAIVSYNETMDAVAAGLLDGHITSTVYFSGKDPAFAILGDLIAAYEHPFQDQAFLEYRGGNELMRELLSPYGLYFIGGTWTGKESFVSTIPIESADDFKGVKLRSPEGMAQRIFEAVGASPVNLPVAEVYTAIERGVVDAADWGTFSMNDQIGFHRIAKFPIYPGIHSMPVIEVSVNQDRWDALSDDLKAIMTVAVRDYARDMVQHLEYEDLKRVREARKNGITIIDWSDEERRKFREVAVGIWKDWADRSPLAKKAYDAQMAYLREIGLLD